MMVRMPRRPGVRLKALLLALVLATGYLLPEADAVLFHGRPERDAGRSHIEQPSGCGAHSEHCVLDVLLGRPQFARAHRPVPSVRVVFVVVPAATFLALPRASVPRSAHRTRGPPTPLA